MNTKLNWKKEFFKCTYEIFSQGLSVGKLKESFMKQTAEGELYDKKIVFKTTGFLKQETQIIDPVSQKVIGKIVYNSWMTKATIEYADTIVNWKYENVWNTRWSISDNNRMLVKYTGSSSGGEIGANTQDELLILTGLFITNYYWQTTLAVILIALIPVMI